MRAAAAEAIAKIAQSVHRGNIDREALGVQGNTITFNAAISACAKGQ